MEKKNRITSNLLPTYATRCGSSLHTERVEYAIRKGAGFMACRKALNVSRGDKKACPFSMIVALGGEILV